MFLIKCPLSLSLSLGHGRQPWATLTFPNKQQSKVRTRTEGCQPLIPDFLLFLTTWPTWLRILRQLFALMELKLVSSKSIVYFVQMSNILSLILYSANTAPSPNFNAKGVGTLFFLTRIQTDWKKFYEVFTVYSQLPVRLKSTFYS